MIFRNRTKPTLSKSLQSWPRITIGLLALLIGCAIDTAPTLAGGGPENLLLVVNADDPSSLLIANYYQAWRQIPPRNIVYLSKIPKRQVTSLKVFQEQILDPILAEIEARNLAGQIDYIVYSAGFPTTITINEHVNAFVKLQPGQPANAGPNRAYNPKASINALTYFALAVKADSPHYLSFNSNWYYRDSATISLLRPFVNETQKQYETAVVAIKAQDFDAAIDSLTLLAEQNPLQVAAHYQLARAWSGKGDATRCRQALHEAIKAGWSFRDYTQSDPELAAVISSPELQAIVSKMPADPFQFLPSRGFHFRYAWAPNGSINSAPQQGQQYFLSTVLAVTQNLGNSEREALEQLQRSVAADGTMPQGLFAFTLTNDVRTKTREPAFASAIDQLEALQHRAEIFSAAVPGRGPLAGASIGTPNFNWPAKVELLPGAIAENFTSYGGVLEKTGQTKLSEFIRLGAAGTSGTVTEPLAIAAKFPHPQIHVHYARGCTLAEAYYQAVASPFQLLIVGDALCQPWAIQPKFQVTDWESEYPLSGLVEFHTDASQSPVGIAGYEVYLDHRLIARQADLKKFAFDTRQLNDGYHELRIVAIANSHLRTTGRVILPFSVDNHGREVKWINPPSQPLSENETIRLRVESNWGDQIQIIHNQRVIMTAQGQSAEITIAPQQVGRGPVTLYAISLPEKVPSATDRFQAAVASVPLKLEIPGKISTEIPLTEPALLNPPAPKK